MAQRHQFLPRCFALALLTGALMGELRAGSDGKPHKLTTNVQIAPAEQLRPDPAAQQTLAELLEQILEDRKRLELERANALKVLYGPGGTLAIEDQVWGTVKEMILRAAESELDRLASFARQYPRSLEALSAKFLIGKKVALGVPDHPQDSCLPCFREIEDKYPRTREGVMSRSIVLARRLWALVEMQWTMWTPRARRTLRKTARPLLEDSVAAIQEELPVDATIDADASRLGRAYRLMLLSSFDDPEKHQLVPAMRSELAIHLAALGKRDAARELYRSIIRDFPGTRDEFDARIAIGEKGGGVWSPLETLLAGEEREEDAGGTTLLERIGALFEGWPLIPLQLGCGAAVLGFAVARIVTLVRRRRRSTSHGGTSGK